MIQTASEERYPTVHRYRQSHQIFSMPTREEILRIAEISSVCYGKEEVADKAGLLKKILKLGHESVFEHEKFTVKFRTSRGISHELVRHRIASFTQESTRYVDYSKVLPVIIPYWYDTATPAEQACWDYAMRSAQGYYIQLREEGLPKQAARGVLPNDTATNITVTANIREWRHILKLRCAKDAHPDIRNLMMPLLEDFMEIIPELFEDIYEGAVKDNE